MPPHQTRPLLFGPVRNSELFANHWLERRLPLEPEWTERRAEARACLDRIAELWKEQEELAPKYGTEAPLEEAWIQPVLEALGWPLFYQTFIKGRKPDYALFLDKAALRAAVNAGKNEPEFWNHPKIVADAKAWDVSLDHRAKTGSREYPPEQIEWYMNQTGLDWGLLTNGQRWRLIPRQLKRSQGGWAGPCRATGTGDSCHGPGSAGPCGGACNNRKAHGPPEPGPCHENKDAAPKRLIAPIVPGSPPRWAGRARTCGTPSTVRTAGPFRTGLSRSRARSESAQREGPTRLGVA